LHQKKEIEARETQGQHFGKGHDGERCEAQGRKDSITGRKNLGAEGSRNGFLQCKSNIKVFSLIKILSFFFFFLAMQALEERLAESEVKTRALSERNSTTIQNLERIYRTQLAAVSDEVKQLRANNSALQKTMRKMEKTLIFAKGAHDSAREENEFLLARVVELKNKVVYSLSSLSSFRFVS